MKTVNYYSLFVSCLLICACEPRQPALQLITAEEASQAESRSGTVEQSAGPRIEVISPQLAAVVSNPFPIKVNFISESDHRVNMKSLKLTYKKMWGIDITDRVIDYIEGNSINVPETELPKGKHRIEIRIEDMNNNVSTKLVSLEVIDG